MLGLEKVAIGICAATVALAPALAGCGSASPAATMPHATCGTVVTHLLSADTQLLSASPGALNCFGAAVRDCKRASIHVTEMGVDSGTQYVFVTESGSPCRITEFSQDYSANFGGSEGPVVTTTCRTVVLVDSGTALHCSGHAYLIPATVSNREAGG